MSAPNSPILSVCIYKSAIYTKLNPKQSRLKTGNHYLKFGDFVEPCTKLTLPYVP